MRDHCAGEVHESACRTNASTSHIARSANWPGPSHCLHRHDQRRLGCSRLAERSISPRETASGLRERLEYAAGRVEASPGNDGPDSVTGVASTDKIEIFLAERRNAVVAGIRRDGRPHLSPNWFCWDGQRFYVSTARGRVKYAIFRRDPRAQLLIDDPTGFRAVLVPATVEIREDIAAELPRFRAIREKYGMTVPGDEEHLRALAAEGRVLLAFTPDQPLAEWTYWGPD
jgi:PPOX class probable F420-dependent enzyme